MCSLIRWLIHSENEKEARGAKAHIGGSKFRCEIMIEQTREARMRKAAEASSDQDLGTTDEDHAVDKQ